MTYPAFRSGGHVTRNGRDFQGYYDARSGSVLVVIRQDENPDPSVYEWNDYRRGWVAEFPAGEFERIFAVNTFALYQGYRCEVTEMSDNGTAEILYADWNGAWATSAGGFEQRNKYEYYKTVPVSELYDYHEEQLDLLFDEWRDNNFPKPAEVSS